MTQQTWEQRLTLLSKKYGPMGDGIEDDDQAYEAYQMTEDSDDWMRCAVGESLGLEAWAETVEDVDVSERAVAKALAAAFPELHNAGECFHAAIMDSCFDNALEHLDRARHIIKMQGGARRMRAGIKRAIKEQAKAAPCY